MNTKPLNYDDYLRMRNPWAVINCAGFSDAAKDAGVSRIIDTMLDIQLDRRHISPGWPAMSVTALAGEMPGGGGGHDQMFYASQRYAPPDSEWHRACAWLMNKLPKRQAAAMLLQAARVRPGKMGSSPWSLTSSQMVALQDDLLQRIGMKGVAQFESVESLQMCGKRARAFLRSWISSGHAEQKAG